MKAIPVAVYRGRHDCTNGGISAKYSELLVLCDNGFVDVDFEKPPENLAVMVSRNVFGRTVYHIEPYAPAVGCGYMMGGNYAASSDSRFSEICGRMYGAVAIHDRCESWEMYNAMFD